MTTPFHVARGQMGAHEQGVNGQAHVRRLPNGKLQARFVLQTSKGPLAFDASLEDVRAQAAAQSIMGRNEVSQPSLAGHRGHGHHGHHHHHHGGGGRRFAYTGPIGPVYDAGPVYVPVPIETTPTEQAYVVATGGPALTLRSAPAGGEIGSVANGSTFYVQSMERGWAHGRSATSGATGWVDARFLRSAASMRIAGAPAPAKAKTKKRYAPSKAYTQYQNDMATLRANAVQLSGASASGPEHGDAERLLAKVMENDPRAPAALRQIATRAQMGDPNAMALWQGVCNARARAHAGDFTRATAAERAAADRLYLRLRSGDPSAASLVRQIVSLAEQGDVGAIRARKLLCLRHEEAKDTALAGAGLSLSSARIAELLQLVMRARYAPAPEGYRPIPFIPGDEPLPMGPMPGAPLGKMAQYLAEKEAAPLAPKPPPSFYQHTTAPAPQPTSITSVGPAKLATASRLFL